MRQPLATTIFAFPEHVLCLLFEFVLLVTNLSLPSHSHGRADSVWDKESPAWDMRTMVGRGSED